MPGNREYDWHAIPSKILQEWKQWTDKELTKWQESSTYKDRSKLSSGAAPK